MAARLVFLSAGLFIFATGSQAAGYSASVTLGDGTSIGGSSPNAYVSTYVSNNQNGSLQGYGAAFAQFGQLSVSDLAVGNWFHNPPYVNDNGSSSAMSSAQWSDSGVVTSANRAGLARLNFSINLSGLATAAAVSRGPSPATGIVQFSLKLRINDQTYQLSEGASINAAGVASFSDDVNGQNISPFSAFHFSAPITLGTSFAISAELDGRAATTGIQGQFDDGSAFADGNLGIGYSFAAPTIPQLLAVSDPSMDQGFFWGGVDSVTQNGDVIPYAFASESGTDWTVSQIPVASIPEPPIQALLVVGSLGLVAFGRPRRKTRCRPQ